MSFSEALGAVMRRTWLLAVAVVLGAAAVWLVGQPSNVLRTSYNASADLVVADQRTPQQVVLFQYVAESTDAITEVVAVQLGDPWTAERLGTVVSIASEPFIGTMEVGAVDLDSPEEATTIVNAMADEIIRYATAERVAEQDATIAELVRRRGALETEAALLQAQLEAARPEAVEGQPRPQFEDDPILTTQLTAALS